MGSVEDIDDLPTADFSGHTDRVPPALDSGTEVAADCPETPSSLQLRSRFLGFDSNSGLISVSTMMSCRPSPVGAPVMKSTASSLLLTGMRGDRLLAVWEEHGSAR